ncbi:hypothetical protein M0Q28_05770 [Patescibacteria group bacterium]|jgi:hypothetical protein|nr:hypothetical protein [Patescibacteria group bacterium]
MPQFAGMPEGAEVVKYAGMPEGAEVIDEKDVTAPPARSLRALPRDLAHSADVLAGGLVKGTANLAAMGPDAIASALESLGVQRVADWISEKTGVNLGNVSQHPLRADKVTKTLMPNPPVPETMGEKIIEGIGEQIPAMVIPGVAAEAYLAPKLGQIPKLIEAAKVAGKTAFGAGTASGIAREAAPDSPGIDLAAQIAGGVAIGKGPDLYRKGQQAFSALRRGAPSVTEGQLRTKAGQTLNEISGTSEIYDQNAAAATKIEEAIPGFKATIGEKTNDPGLIKKQRSLEAGPDKTAAELMAEKKAVNQVAVKDYLANEFKGDESIDEVIDALNTKKKNIEKTVGWMQGEADQAREALPVAGKQESGQAAVAAIEEARAPLKAKKDVLYAEVGNPPVQTSATKEAVKSLEAEFTPGEEAVYPSGIIAKIKKVLKGKVTDAEPLPPGTEAPPPNPKVAERAEKLAKKGLETAFSRYGKQKIKLTDDIAVVLKEKQQRNLYKLFDKDGRVTWDTVAKELAEEGEIPGFAAGEKIDQSTFVEWLQSNPVLGRSKDVYADRLAKATARVSAAMSDIGERGFQELHSLRKDIGRQISDAVTGANPNMPMARRLYSLRNAIDADIEAALGGENAYQVARDFAREYYLKFRSGAVGKVLQRGGQASGRAVPDAQIPGKLFTIDGADDFIRAVGQENAATVMRQHAAELLMESGAVNKLTNEINTKQFATWVNRNRRVLEKFGIQDDFANVRDAYVALDDLKAMQVEFGKSVASKLLNADPDKAIKAAMQGAEGISGKNTGETMRRLMGQLKDADGVIDKKALLGLKNAFKDFIISEAETTAKTVAGDQIISPAGILKNMKKYEPAMRILYNDEPQKLDALLNVQKAIEIQARSLKSPVGGGSDTFEKLSMAQGVMSRVLDRIPGLSYTGRLARAGLKLVSNLNESELNKLLARAMYDPELAQTLMMAAKNQAPKEVARRINNQLVILSLGVTANKKGEEEEIPTEVPGP